VDCWGVVCVGVYVLVFFLWSVYLCVSVWCVFVCFVCLCLCVVLSCGVRVCVCVSVLSIGVCV